MKLVKSLVLKLGKSLVLKVLVSVGLVLVLVVVISVVLGGGVSVPEVVDTSLTEGNTRVEGGSGVPGAPVVGGSGGSVGVPVVGGDTPVSNVVGGSGGVSGGSSGSVGGSGGVSSVEPSDGVTVDYSHNLLGISLRYPKTWFAEENSSTVMNELNLLGVRGSIVLSAVSLTRSLEVVRFSARDENNTNITLYINPLQTSIMSVNNTFLRMTDILNNGVRGEIVDNKFVMAEFITQGLMGEEIRVVQVSKPIGRNFVVLRAETSGSIDSVDKMEVLLHMINTLVVGQ